MEPLPQLIVFDLDFTLWDCGGTYCDCLSAPFYEKAGIVFDGSGRQLQLYPDVDSIIQHCDRAGIELAIASRTLEPAWARQILDLMNASQHFSFSEIYPSSKLQHFEALQRDSGIDFHDMLFFADEMRNVREVSELGVTCIFVENGMTTAVFEDGLRRFQQA